jgi:hypothetical protein
MKLAICFTTILILFCFNGTAQSEQTSNQQQNTPNFRIPGNSKEVKTLPYGAKPETDRFYNVRTTLYGCAGDDNGIGFHGGIDLWALKWGVAELGFRGGKTGTALGGIPGGTIATIRHPKTRRMVNVVFADVGGGHNYYQLDLHCGVAKAIGLEDTGTIQIAIRNKRIRLTTTGINRGYDILGPVRKPCTRTMQSCKPPKQSTS